MHQAILTAVIVRFLLSFRLLQVHDITFNAIICFIIIAFIASVGVTWSTHFRIASIDPMMRPFLRLSRKRVDLKTMFTQHGHWDPPQEFFRSSSFLGDSYTLSERGLTKNKTAESLNVVTYFKSLKVILSVSYYAHSLSRKKMTGRPKFNLK